MSAEAAVGGIQNGNVCRYYLEGSAAQHADALLVVFSGHFANLAERGAEIPFEFRRFLSRHPLSIHLLFLRDPTMTWYLDGIEGVGNTVDEIASFISRERELLAVPSLFTLGSSMGGFAALLFGHILQADVVLAFGPQVFLDTKTRRELEVDSYSYAPRLAEVEQLAAASHNEKYLKLTNFVPFKFGKAHIHLGQNEPSDLRQAARLNNLPNVKFVVWPGGNHMVVKALRDEGKLLPLLKKHFISQVGNSLAGTEGDPEDVEVLRLRGNELVKTGKYSEAAEQYSKALQAGGGDSHHLILANRALCWLRAGRAEEAWHDCDAALCLDPKYTKALYRRALCEVELGFLASALQSAEKARKLDADDKALQKLEVDLRKRLADKPDGPPANAPFATYCE